MTGKWLRTPYWNSAPAKLGGKMVTVFGNNERNLYNAFFISENKKRRIALDGWIKSTAPAIQSAVTSELEDFVESFTENAWTDEDWINRQGKIRAIETDYHLVLEIKLRRINPSEKYRGTLPGAIIRPDIGSKVNKIESIPEPIMKRSEIDLHGMTVTNALFHVDDFLKDCHKTDEKIVLIIHGKGTGVLRNAVRKHLAQHPLVKCFSEADNRHGGEGAIQVNLKD